MKCFLILPGLFSLAGHAYTRNATNFSTRKKYTLYVSGPPPPTCTPLFCGRTIPSVLSVWLKKEDSAIAPPPLLLATYPVFLLFWPLLLLLSSCTPLYPGIPKLTPRCTTLLWSCQCLSGVPAYQTSLPYLSYSSTPISDCAPLFVRRLHRKQCSAHLPPSQICGVTFEVRRLPVGPPLPLNPPKC